jgi:hypothetical protein
MSDRRSLVEGLKTVPQTESAAEKAFVYKKVETQPVPPSVTLNRMPISTRMREDFAKALKRASLERQLDGTEPNTLQDILEAAIEPWLKSNGYLP